MEPKVMSADARVIARYRVCMETADMTSRTQEARAIVLLGHFSSSSFETPTALLLSASTWP